MAYQVTENDVQTFVQWASAHQIKNEDADTTGDTHYNNQTVYDYMNRWGGPVDSGQPR
jgi:hypothetical protein